MVLILCANSIPQSKYHLLYHHTSKTYSMNSSYFQNIMKIIILRSLQLQSVLHKLGLLFPCFFIDNLEETCLTCTLPCLCTLPLFNTTKGYKVLTEALKYEPWYIDLPNFDQFKVTFHNLTVFMNQRMFQK